MRETLTSKFTIIVLLASTGLSGCAGFGANLSNPLDRFRPEATIIEAAAPTPPEPKWATYVPSALPSTDWVGDFNDPTLSRIVDTALVANPDVRSARARFDAAEQSVTIASQGLRPAISATGRASHSEFGNEFVGDSNSLNGGIGASWEADVWGRVRDTANASELEYDASGADYAAARLAIAGRSAQAWFNLIEARLQFELAQRNLENQNRALRLTERRFRSGLTTSADVRISRSSVASAEASLATRRQQQTASSRAIEILLREYPQAQLEASRDLPELPPLPGLPNPEGMLVRRPDLIAAERRMAAQGLRVDIAQKALLPRLTLSADGNLQAGDITELFDIDALVGTILANLVAPIYQAGALKAEVKRNEAVLRQQIENYASTVLTAYLEVENALDAEQRLAEREAALRVALQEADQAVVRLERQYSQGLVNILQVLDAQSRAINAEGALISARKERLANRVRLHLALGGGSYGAPASIATTP